MSETANFPNVPNKQVQFKQYDNFFLRELYVSVSYTQNRLLRIKPIVNYFPIFKPTTSQGMFKTGVTICIGK